MLADACEPFWPCDYGRGLPSSDLSHFSCSVWTVPPALVHAGSRQERTAPVVSVSPFTIKLTASRTYGGPSHGASPAFSFRSGWAEQLLQWASLARSASSDNSGTSNFSWLRGHLRAWKGASSTGRPGRFLGHSHRSKNRNFSLQWSPSVRKQLKAGKLCTDVLVVALSNAGRRVVHSILQKELVGSVMQAGIPLVSGPFGTWSQYAEATQPAMRYASTNGYVSKLFVPILDFDSLGSRVEDWPAEVDLLILVSFRLVTA